ncbi:MAG TPA: metal ABC transporter permease [candidate division Zixibacteria bacterium]|nr:metal ABC transporter permease [candidate division Zixibacteria bacterium]
MTPIEYIELLLWPFLFCVALISMYVYLGLHIVKRGVIFVDLALAQMAAVGVTIGTLLGFDERDVTSYLLAFGAAVVGSVIFTLTRSLNSRIPQEAVIGVVYAVGSAAVIVLVSHSPEGAEHVRHLLAGALLTVSAGETARVAALFAALALFHWIFRSRFLELTFKGTTKQARLWDFLFYATFALSVTATVRTSGVLLIFIFLVGPALAAAFIGGSVRRSLALGWTFGIVGSVLGLTASVVFDTPPGATLVCGFGVIIALSAVAPFLLPGGRRN